MERRVQSTLSVNLCHASLLVMTEYKVHTVQSECMTIKKTLICVFISRPTESRMRSFSFFLTLYVK